METVLLYNKCLSVEPEMYCDQKGISADCWMSDSSTNAKAVFERQCFNFSLVSTLQCLEVTLSDNILETFSSS